MPIREDTRHVAHQPASAGITVWGVFAGVLLALVAHDVLVIVADALRNRYAPQRFSFAEPIRLGPPPSRRQAEPERLPGYPGSITARRHGAQFACIDGRTMRRLDNGWEQTGERCRATSQ